MPIYCFSCPGCGHDQTEVYSIEDIETVTKCDMCRDQTQRVIAPTSKAVVHEYYSKELKGMVTGPAQRLRLAASRGLTPL